MFEHKHNYHSVSLSSITLFGEDSWPFLCFLLGYIVILCYYLLLKRSLSVSSLKIIRMGVTNYAVHIYHAVTVLFSVFEVSEHKDAEVMVWMHRGTMIRGPHSIGQSCSLMQRYLAPWVAEQRWLEVDLHRSIPGGRRHALITAHQQCTSKSAGMKQAHYLCELSFCCLGK